MRSVEFVMPRHPIRSPVIGRCDRGSGSGGGTRCTRGTPTPSRSVSSVFYSTRVWRVGPLSVWATGRWVKGSRGKVGIVAPPPPMSGRAHRGTTPRLPQAREAPPAPARCRGTAIPLPRHTAFPYTPHEARSRALALPIARRRSWSTSRTHRMKREPRPYPAHLIRRCPTRLALPTHAKRGPRDSARSTIGSAPNSVSCTADRRRIAPSQRPCVLPDAPLYWPSLSRDSRPTEAPQRTR